LKRILLVGGDRRALLLSGLLADDGYTVETIGLTDSDQEKVHIGQADAVLFPYPFSVKAGCVPVLEGDSIRPEEILMQLKKDACILSGAGLAGYVPQKTFRWMRYTDAPEFAERNAALSAEAAVCEAMLHGRLALMDMQILVTGYGLFGRALAQKLRALGAKVWVAARREAQRNQAVADGMKALSLQELETVLPRMNLVLNTIPANILDEHLLKRIPRDCWLLEMASAPYGFDRELAKALGVSCAHLPGLPARYAPASAALILYDAVRELLGRCAE